MKELFGRRLRQARERMDLSQRGLGVCIGLPPKKASVYVNRWERQGVQPNWEAIGRLAKVLEVSPAYFLADNDVMAELILLAGEMRQKERRALVSTLQKQK